MEFIDRSNEEQSENEENFFQLDSEDDMGGLQQRSPVAGNMMLLSQFMRNDFEDEEDDEDAALFEQEMQHDRRYQTD